MILAELPVRIEDRAERAQRDREPVARRAGILVGPEPLDHLVARHGLSAARGEHLQEIARLLRLPRLGRDRLAVPQNAEAAERLQRERRRGVWLYGHQHPCGSAVRVAEPELAQLTFDARGLEPRAG